jgi:DNA repair protein RadC
MTKGESAEKEKSLTVLSLPKNERPRERLKNVGVKNISAQELLAVILGRGIKGESVLITVQRMLERFKSIKNLSEASLEDLKEIRGIGPAKAAQLAACFELPRRIKQERLENSNTVEEMNGKTEITNPDMLCDIIRNKITDYSKEHFFVISLNSRSKLISIEPITIGILTASLVHPRETFGSAIRSHATQIIIAHNHPSGDAGPSDEDMKVTRRLLEAGKIMGIELIDHLIVTSNGYFSFRKENLVFD